MLLLYHIHIHLRVEHRSRYTHKGSGCHGKNLSLSSRRRSGKMGLYETGEHIDLMPVLKD